VEEKQMKVTKNSLILLVTIVFILAITGEVCSAKGLNFFKRGVESASKGDIHSAKLDFEKAFSRHHSHIFKMCLEVIERVEAGKLDKDSAICFFQGIHYYEEKKMDKALYYCKKATNIEPEFKEAYLLKGKIYFKQGKRRDAIANLNKAIKIDPNFSLAYEARGIAYLAEKRINLAFSDFKKAIELDSTLGEAYFGRGMIYFIRRRYKLALYDLDNATKLNPNIALPYLIKGITLLKLKQYHSALISLNKAIQIKSSFAEAFFNRGIVYTKLHEYDKAISDFSNATKLKPELAPKARPWLGVAYNGKGLIYANMEQYEEAIESYNKAIELNPKLAVAYNNRGVVFAKEFQFEAAINDFNKAIHLNPKLTVAYDNRKVAYKSLQELRQIRYKLNRNSRYNNGFNNHRVGVNNGGDFEEFLEDIARMTGKFLLEMGQNYTELGSVSFVQKGGARSGRKYIRKGKMYKIIGAALAALTGETVSLNQWWQDRSRYYDRTHAVPPTFDNLVKVMYHMAHVRSYVKHYFDCSERAAYFEWALESMGFDTYIAVGKAPWEPDWSPTSKPDHAWLIVKTLDGVVAIEDTDQTLGGFNSKNCSCCIAPGVIVYGVPKTPRCIVITST